MKKDYIKKLSFSFVIISLLALNNLYFLLSGFQNNLDRCQHWILDFPFQFPIQKIPKLTPISKELEVSAFGFDYWIRTACRRYSLDPALVKAVIQAESKFDPLAVSPKGAVGLMQIAPITVRELGIKDPFDPKHNIDGGVRYLRELLDAFEGDQKLARAAYNAGPARVYKHNGTPPFKNTKKYINQVFRYLTYYQKTG